MKNANHLGHQANLLHLNASDLSQRIRSLNTRDPYLLTSLHNELEKIYAATSLDIPTTQEIYCHGYYKDKILLNTKGRIIWIANSINLSTPLRCSHMRSVGATLIPHLLTGADVHYVLCGLPCGGVGSPEGNASNIHIPRYSEMKHILTQNLGHLGALININSLGVDRESATIFDRITRVVNILGSLEINGNDTIIHQGCILGSTLPMHLLRNFDCRQFVHMMCIDNDISSLPKSVVALSPSPNAPRFRASYSHQKRVYKRPSVNLVAPMTSRPNETYPEGLQRISSWLAKLTNPRILISCGAHLQTRIDQAWLTEVSAFARRTTAHILLIGVTANQADIYKMLDWPRSDTSSNFIHICGWIADPTHIFKRLARKNIAPSYIFPGNSGGGHDQICALWHGIPVYMHGEKDSACSLPPDVFFGSTKQALNQIEIHWASSSLRNDFLCNTRRALKDSFTKHLEYSLSLYQWKPQRYSH